MINVSRRRLMLTASTGAMAAAITASISLADLFVPTDVEKKPETSFKVARSITDELVGKEIFRSQQDFNRTYSPAEVTAIKNRIWDKTQLVMLQFYRPSEKE